MTNTNRFFTRREGLRAFLFAKRGKVIAIILVVCFVVLIALWIVSLLNPPPLK